MAEIVLAEDIEENTIDAAPLEEPASTESDGTASAKDVEGPRDFESGKLRKNRCSLRAIQGLIHSTRLRFFVGSSSSSESKSSSNNTPRIRFLSAILFT